MEWRDTIYNIGNYFDGTYFTVPTAGLYSFNVSCSHQSDACYIYIFDNSGIRSRAYREHLSGDSGGVAIQTTLKLTENDKIHVRIRYNLCDTQDANTTFFEGRLIARLDE